MIPEAEASTLAVLAPAYASDWSLPRFADHLSRHGSHMMRLRQPSRQVESSREYVNGDPVNLIDWKAFARTDQLIVREVRDQSRAHVKIYCDLGPAMRWPTAEVLRKTGRQDVIPKGELAQRLTFFLADLHLAQGDRINLRFLTTDHGSAYHELAVKSSADVRGVFERIMAAQFLVSEIEQATRAVDNEIEEAPADICWWIGDLLGRADFLKPLRHSRLPILIHTLSSLERDVSWLQSDTAYFDEAYQRLEFQGQILWEGEAYLDQVLRWARNNRQKVTDIGGYFFEVSERTPIRSLLSFLDDLRRQVHP